ncbi:uncharacterized protein [Centruroides vittatus]|uniref:uncharacterized protein n=1 Tax=Centruroides vittatus TaxID=120091 RepID=UPI00350FDCF6
MPDIEVCKCLKSSSNEIIFKCWYCLTKSIHSRLRWAGLSFKKLDKKIHYYDLTVFFLLFSFTIFHLILIIMNIFNCENSLRIALHEVFGKNYNDVIFLLFDIALLSTIYSYLFNFTSLPSKSERQISTLWSRTFDHATLSHSLETYRILLKIERIFSKMIIPVFLFTCVTVVLMSIYNVNKVFLKYISKLSILCIYVHFFLCSNAICFLVMAELNYGILICIILKRKFDEVSLHFQYILNNLTEIYNVKAIQFRHHLVTLLVQATDIMFQWILFLLYTLVVPLMFIGLKSFFHDKEMFIKIIIYFFSIISLFGICGFTVLAGYVNVAAHRIREVVIELCDEEIPTDIRLQLNIFLGRLKGSPIGLTCLGIFVVTPNTLSSIFSLLLTYLLMYYQYEETNK